MREKWEGETDRDRDRLDREEGRQGRNLKTSTLQLGSLHFPEPLYSPELRDTTA